MHQQIDETKNDQKLDFKHPLWLWLIPLVSAILFDQLFWRKTPGVVFLAIVILILLGGFINALIQKKHVPFTSWILLLPILFGAVMTIFRLDAFTNAANILVSLYALVLLAMTFLNGEWFTYRLRDILEGAVKLFVSILIDPIRLLVSSVKKNAQKAPGEKRASSRKISAVLRGLLIALPLVIILGALLASADLIFSEKITGAFKWLKIENFGQFVFRFIYVMVLAYGLCGAFIYILSQTQPKQAKTEEKPFVAPFLGKTEALIVLACVNLLFAVFLVVQFRYFFGGNANITFEGFTYAEYARKGFFELVTVAIISLLLFFVLSHITKRSAGRERWIFSILGILLILQVGVMLLSAHYRLSLYETAYGFTQARTVTHVFIIWLAVLLPAMVVLEVSQRLGRVAIVLFLVAVGFMVTLNFINVDKFIVEKNITHASEDNDLDIHYLVWSLSEDGTPALFDAYLAPNMDPDLKQQIGAVLACRSVNAETRSENWSWVSWHASRDKASQLYKENAPLLADYELQDSEEGYWTVILNGKTRPCYDLVHGFETQKGADFLD